MSTVHAPVSAWSCLSPDSDPQLPVREAAVSGTGFAWATRSHLLRLLSWREISSRGPEDAGEHLHDCWACFRPPTAVRHNSQHACSSCILPFPQKAASESTPDGGSPAPGCSLPPARVPLDSTWLPVPLNPPASSLVLPVSRSSQEEFHTCDLGSFCGGKSKGLFQRTSPRFAEPATHIPCPAEASFANTACSAQTAALD